MRAVLKGSESRAVHTASVAEGPAQGLPAICGSVAELRAMRPAFVRSLHAEFDLADLRSMVCPVLLDDQRVRLLVLPEYLEGDATDEVQRLVRRHGWPLSTPARQAASTSLLLTLARDPAPSVVAEPADSLRMSSSALQLLFHEIVSQALRLEASDLHLRVDEPSRDAEIRCTVDGMYVPIPTLAPVPARMLRDMLAVVWMDVRGGNGAVFDPLAEQQGQLLHDHAGEPVLLRWASLATDTGPAVCLRLTRRKPAQQARLRRLGFLPAQLARIETACRIEGGAVVVSGRVGSGKSTTLAAMLAALPGTRKLITLEDPVETPIAGALQNTVVRDLGPSEGHPFDAKLKTVKRSALQDFYLGEVRDHDTGRAFADMASAGISVYTTVHAGSAQSIVDRLASDFIGVSRDLLNAPGLIKLRIYQTLAPRLCRHCALPPWEWLQRDHRRGNEWRRWRAGWARGERRMPGTLRRVRYRNEQGCPHCTRGRPAALWGYAGRLVVADVLAEARGEADRIVSTDAGPPSGVLPVMPLLHAGGVRVLHGDIDPRWLADLAGGVAPLMRMARAAPLPAHRSLSRRPRPRWREVA